MNPNTTMMLSTAFIRQLYLGLKRQIKQPTVQILGFEVSQSNKNQIILRISDGETFIDCPLVGLYRVYEGKIISSQQNSVINTFQKYDIIKVYDYFSKIDQHKICSLKIIIRKIVQIGHISQKIGFPQEIAQFIQNNNLSHEKKQRVTHQYKNTQVLKNGNDEGKPIKLQDLEEDNQYHTINSQNYMNISNNSLNSSNGMLNSSTMSIGFNQQARPILMNNNNINNTNGLTNNLNQSFSSNNIIQSNPTQFRYQSLLQAPQRDSQTPLTLRQILQQFEGFFIGRLLRIKTTIKQTKDGPMTVLFLGFVDKNNEMVRINVAGRIALKQQKNLKKNKCYYIKGIQLVKSKLISPQIRLKDKQYKIHQIANEQITKQYQTSYYHWDHEADFIQYENVDVIGIVDQIEEKTSYKQNATNDQRDVVRVVIRNKYKTVKVSFWADQIKNLQGFQLKLKQPIILQDIKKKKSFFLDFTFQSSLVKLNDEPQLKEKFMSLIPSGEQRPQPKNIKQLKKIYEQQPSNTKVRSLNVFIIKIHQNRIIYKLCEDCKKKVQRNTQICRDCGTSNFAYKFNCQIQFSDYSDSLTGVIFDITAHRLFDKTAAQINQMSQQQIQHMIQSYEFREYFIGFENKRQKIVVRMAEIIQQNEINKWTESNVNEIYGLMKQEKQNKMVKINEE